MREDFQKRIREANIAVHHLEAEYYELLHPEVYIKQEQKRIISILRCIDKLIVNNQKRALDIGAGTGNIAEKLLRMGYQVTAADLSVEMCTILEKKFKTDIETKRLKIVNAPVEDLDFGKGEFDLITCYSVLHHLPDYIGEIKRITGFLKQGGVIYLDHEASPYHWENEKNNFANFVKQIYFHSNPLLNTLYFQIMAIDIPNIDYGLSDYWHKKEHHINHNKVESVFRNKKFEFFKRTDYHLRGTWIPNPIFYLYKYLCRPEMSYWLAQK